MLLLSEMCFNCYQHLSASGIQSDKWIKCSRFVGLLGQHRPSVLSLPINNPVTTLNDKS